MQPVFPLYIVSKGRWRERLTSRWLEHTRTPYRIVVEESEYAEYSAVIDPAKILVLDPLFKQEYDTFNDVGPEGTTGSGPARNFAWEHSVGEGHDFHWVMDDNIYSFQYLHGNRRLRAGDGAPLRIIEEFMMQYRNLAMTGPNYKMFAPSKTRRVPLTVNTRIYSCNLIRNAIPMRWRGRYNEDTDLSLRILKAGWCTVIFNLVLQEKLSTQRQKGGNTAELYAKGTWDKSRQLYDMHPDVTVITKRFGRWHHLVDYKRFSGNRLVKDPSYAEREPLTWSFDTMAVDNSQVDMTSKADIDNMEFVSEGLQTLEEAGLA